MPGRVGQQLGNYRLVRLLGRGGFAEVYLGEHQRLGTQAAIKVLYTHLAEQDVDSFLAEARTIASLEHPHIVRVLDFDVQEGSAFLVMSYASQGSLRLHHPKGSRLPLNAIVDYVKQVASALQYAHNEKIIHRDIKPENMLLGRHNEVLLSDFGIALIAQSSRLQSTQEVIGTAQYMAPEQLQGKPRLASDQYSLGVVVYEWLCGERPFQGTFTELFSQHMFVPPPPLHEKLPTISLDVEQVVLTALAKDPHQRFGSVQAFATALEQACQNVPTRSVTLPLEVPPPKQTSLLTNTVAASPPVQSTQLTTVFTPSSQILQPPVTSALFPTPTDNHRQGRYRTRTVLLIGLALLIVVGSFAFFLLPRGYEIFPPNTVATATAATSQIFATRTVQAFATAVTLQQMYNQATSGTPAMNDPLSDDRNRWGVFTTNWGGQCAFTGGAYHISLAKAGYLIECTGSPMANISNNFALQVQFNIQQGDEAAIVIDANPRVKAYRIDINSTGAYTFYEYTTTNGWQILQNGSNPAIQSGLNQTNVATIIMSNDNFYFYVNGQNVINTYLSGYVQGGAELAAQSDSQPTDVAFSNLKIWNL